MAHKTTILLLSFLAGTVGIVACSGQTGRDVELRFALMDSGGATVRDLSFYLHEVALLDADGGAHEVRLTAKPPWQSERVALIDMVGASMADRNDVVRGRVAGRKEEYVGVRLTAGVPFELNHGNPLTAAAPLDRGDMFWAWQTGYKFLRVDLSEQGREWSFHLGSTGCSSASALRPPSQQCAQPNLIRIELRGGDPLTQPVMLDVEALAEAMHASARACTGDYANDAACAAPYALTGLGAQTGRCESDVCGKQRLLRWK